jgi:hypothetical protein
MRQCSRGLLGRFRGRLLVGRFPAWANPVEFSFGYVAKGFDRLAKLLLGRCVGQRLKRKTTGDFELDQRLDLLLLGFGRDRRAFRLRLRVKRVLVDQPRATFARASCVGRTSGAEGLSPRFRARFRRARGGRFRWHASGKSPSSEFFTSARLVDAQRAEGSDETVRPRLA